MDNNAVRMRRKRRKQRISLMTNIVFCVITLFALTGCMILLLQNYSLKSKGQEAMARLETMESERETYIYSQADLDAHIREAVDELKGEEREKILADMKGRMGSGDSVAEMLREYYTEDVVVYADGQYNFFPIRDDLKQHNFVYDNFKELSNGEVVYTDDADEVLSVKGIDVSKYQGKIDWEEVASDGVEFAMIRCGIRGTAEEGRLVEDENFATNMKGALSNGIDAGVYFFTQAVTEEEAIEEAEMVLELIAPYHVDFPVVLDVEEVTGSGVRTRGLTQEEYTRNCIAFCETIKEAGYTPMIYGNLKTFMIMLDMEQLEEYDKWFAYYNTPVYFPYEFSMWQYSSKGSVKGIEGDVDLNICMKKYK